MVILTPASLGWARYPCALRSHTPRDGDQRRTSCVHSTSPESTHREKDYEVIEAESRNDSGRGNPRPNGAREEEELRLPRRSCGLVALAKFGSNCHTSPAQCRQAT